MNYIKSGILFKSGAFFTLLFLFFFYIDAGKSIINENPCSFLTFTGRFFTFYIMTDFLKPVYASNGKNHSDNIIKVPATKYADGFDSFTIRKDFINQYIKAFNEITSYKGGMLPSSGGLRPLEAEVSAGRSKTSLHYLGRAVDIYIHAGMQTEKDRYIIVRDGGTEEKPLWKVYCIVDDEKIKPQKLTGSIWQKGDYPSEFTATARVICITEIMQKNGWKRISSRKGWKDEYLCMEWWHFQDEDGLIENKSLFLDELRKIYTDDIIMASPLSSVDAVWSNRSFVIKNNL